MATAWGAIQATREAEAHVARQVAKLRTLYWFGVVFLLLHAVPALCIGGYSLGKANQFSEVYCASEERPAGSEVFEPDVMIANMDMLGSFWIAGGVFFLFLVYVVIVWFNRLQKVVQMPRLKGKVIGGFREFGTIGVLSVFTIFSCGVFCYVMWVIALLALSASTAASAEDCGADVGPGGEAQAAAELVLFLAWVFVIATGGEVVLFFFWLKVRKKRATDFTKQYEASDSLNAGHEDEDEDEDEDADAGSSLVTPVGRSGRALPPLPPVGGSGSDLALANEQHYGIGEAP